MLRNAVGVGGVSFPGKKRYEGVRLFALQGGGWWSNSLEKKRYEGVRLLALQGGGWWSKSVI